MDLANNQIRACFAGEDSQHNTTGRWWHGEILPGRTPLIVLRRDDVGGYVASHLLHQASPGHFTGTWMDNLGHAGDIELILQTSGQAAAPVSRLSMELADGSRLVGTTTWRSLTINTDSSGEVDIPLAAVRSIDFDRAAGKHNIHAHGGRVIQGMLAVSNFDLETAAGSLVVPTREIVRVVHCGVADLAAYYPLDGNTSDQSGNGNEAVEHGGLVYQEGVSGQAARLDGIDDFIEIPNNGLLNSESTLAFWIKLNKSGDYSLVSKALLGNGYGIWIGRDVNFNQGQSRSGLVSFGFDGRGVQWNWQMITADKAIDPGEWHHIAAVLSDSGQRLYIDGKETASRSTRDTPYIDRPIWIGKEMVIGGALLDGLVDEVRVYGRALSSKEVMWLYEGNVVVADSSVQGSR